MVIIKAVGMTIKREQTPLCEIFDALNEMVTKEIIAGYLVSVRDGNVIINIKERG